MQTQSWNHFVDHFISALNKIVPFQSFFAYHVTTPNNAFTSYYSQNLSRQSIQHYIEHMFQYDPICLLNQNSPNSEVTHLQQRDIPKPYHDFLKQTQVSDNVEVLFKSKTGPCLGISLIRGKDEQIFSPQEIQIIESCYQLAQFNANEYLNVKSENAIPEHILQDLTRSERQVLNHILTGKKNQEIADELFVSLATVKTHIHHIFQKTMVKSKRELILKVLNQQ